MDPISLTLGTRFGSIKHIKKTAITNQKPPRNFFTVRENVKVHESRFLQNSQGISFGKNKSHCSSNAELLHIYFYSVHGAEI